MDIYELLTKLGLWEYYPGKLKRHLLFSAKEHPDSSKTLEGFQTELNEHKQKYMCGITHFDGNCRFYKKNAGSCKSYKEKQRQNARYLHSVTSDIHPLDVSTALFLCCDNVARQDLVLHYWGCKHAFPVVIQTGQLESPVLYLWPVRSLLYSSNIYDKPILKYITKTVSALRFKEQDSSKSNLLNMIISKSEKVHSSFFHRNCTGSTREKAEICEGLIEAMPVLDSKDSPLLYFNLRGNCTNYPDQRRFLVMSSDVVILLCKTDETKLLTEFVSDMVNYNNPFLILVFTDLDAADSNVALHLKIETLTDNLPITNTVIAYKNLSHPEFIDDIWQIINGVKATCTEEKLIICSRTNNIEVDLNSIDGTLKMTKCFSDKIVEKFKCNSNIFPLQGKEGLEWSKADFEIYKLRHWDRGLRGSNVNVLKYREELEQEKIKLRTIQLKMIQKDEIWIIREFIQNIVLTTKVKDLDVEVFLRALKLQFEDETRSCVKPLHKRYATLLDQHMLCKSNAKEIEEEMEKVDKSFNNFSLSLTLFLREMGQMFEAMVAQADNRNISDELLPERLIEAAVEVLMSGYQIEIIDGRTNHVPIKWIQGILLKLHSKLKNVRIKVITVLGVQSSGKSTLLNIMFGSQFDVSSGRCTRGVHIHLVTVSPDIAKEYLVDYLIIIDTEGLFSTILKLDRDERNQEERQLATFVIGLSHITILNIMGENITYLRDILPISVQAFLRMELAGLNSKCFLLRHGVDKTRKDQLLCQTYNLENELDSFTAAACKLERVPIRRFKDIIQFDITHDNYFFPALFEYCNDFEIISPPYCKTAMLLKQNILADRDTTGTLLELHSHLGYLSSAIKRDNFVYEFKNIIEMEAQAVMDKRIWHLQWHIRRELQDNTSFFKQQVANCNNVKDLSQIESNFYAQTRKMMQEQQQKNHDKLSLGVPNTSLSKAIVKLRDSGFKKLQNTIEDCNSLCTAQFERDLSYRRTEVKLLENDELVLTEIDGFLTRTLSVERTILDDERKLPDILFHKWCKSLWKSKLYTQHFDYEEDAANCIYAIFFAHRAKVDTILQEKSITERNMDDFQRNISCNWNSLSAYRFNGQIEMAKEIARDSFGYVQRLLNQVKTMQLFYHAEIFKDIALEVRNHRYLYHGDVVIKPSFEIELAISLCAEFIKGLHAIENDNNVLSDRLMQSTECYFKRTCREKMEYFTNISEAVEAFTCIIVKELGKSLLKRLPQELAMHLKNECPFIASKQTLLCHVWLILLDQQEFLHIYLNSPVKALEICIKNIFDDAVLKKEDQVNDIIVKYVDKHLKIISRRLLKANKIFENVKNLSKSNSMQNCVEILCSSLDGSITLNDVKVLANDKINDTNALAITSRIIESLNEQSVNSTVAQQIQQSFIDTKYDVIRHETVQEVLEYLLGCKSMCPSCGELCCIGQEGHEGEHKALMHKPVGFQESFGKSKHIAPKTCWDECEIQRSREHLLPIVTKGWFIPSDVSVEDNSYWKFMFASFSDQIASARGLEAADIPNSWKTLTRNAEIKKLKIMVARINELQMS